MAAICDLEVIPIMTTALNADDCDGTSDTVIVRVTDENGLQGIGETDAPPNLVAAFFEQPNLHIWSQNAKDLVIGADPFELTALYERVYEGTIYPGRRGLGVHALSALDIALHDLVGKQLGRPVYQLLGGRRRDVLEPYATVFPGLPQGRLLTEVLAEIRTMFERALDTGFRAVKMEVMFYDAATDRQIVDAIREGRSWLGDDIRLMIDFGYRWRDWRDALWVLRRIEECDIYFAEAPLRHDDLYGHAKLAERSEIRIGGAELSATRFECREWLATGVDVLQPDINRCGGLTEIGRIAAEADAAGRVVVPHGYKTGITAAVSRHFHAATINSPTFEFLSPLLSDSPIRRELVSPEPEVRDGFMSLPDAPGLGVELDPDVVERYRIDLVSM